MLHCDRRRHHRQDSRHTGIQAVVADAEAARRQLLDAGVDASEVEVRPWGNFVYFGDPDGNRWPLQAIESRPNG
ncbi:hypothetical protein ABZ783_36575 [Micromonospora sp. NPDC047738]|uniref:VOC family protein n=1 Tax=Micromonospora sp. NPDC047738 TaxID=3155741 RepID=UPI0033D78C38